MYARGQKCVECGAEQPLDSPIYKCPSCGGALEITYNYGEMVSETTKEDLGRYARGSMWRYSSLLPVRPEQIISLGEGLTPIVEAEKIGAWPARRRCC